MTRPEREDDLLVLNLCFTVPVGLGAPPAKAACRVGDDESRRLCLHARRATQQHELSPVQGRRMCLIAREYLDDDDDALAARRPGPRCSARARSGLASQSIEDSLQ